MKFVLFLLQNIDIEQKLKDAPNDDYGIGIFIGSLLPFVVLVIIAYAIFRYNKNKLNHE